MGATLSTPPKTLTPAQQDVKYLGERMPFGDAELFQVYRAYQALKAKEERISFLTDIGVPSVDAELQDERLVLMQAMENKILPLNFGNRLYQRAFLSKGSKSEYENDSHSPGATPVDEFTRRSQLEAFFDGLSNCGRRGSKKSLKALFDCCEQHPAPAPNGVMPSTPAFGYASPGASSSDSVVKPLELVEMAYRVGLASAFLSATWQNKEECDDVSRFLPSEDVSQHAGLVSLAESLVDFATKRDQRQNPAYVPPEEVKRKEMVNEQDAQEWMEQVAPMFAASLATLTHYVFFPNRVYPPTRSKFDFPSSLGFESTFFTEGNSPLLYTFGCLSPALGGEYYRLYTSASDGLSFNRLQNALLGYGGPTLIIIQSGKSVFGAFTASQWKESKDFYGNHDCFLFQLQPKTTVLRPSGNDSNFMYCNSFARSRGYDQQAHGIGFGGTIDKPRLFLDESFDNCQAASQDLTFENGRLLDDKSSDFDIDNLEVWGVGGTEVVSEALGARDRQRDIKSAAIRKARKVDKAQFLDDFRSGLIESKAFAHREQIRGRGSAAVDDEHLNAYKVVEKL